jgi:hypothetical protein
MDYFKIVRAPTIIGAGRCSVSAESSNAGFNVKEVEMLATGFRGALFLGKREFHGLRFKRVGVYGHALSVEVGANPAV